MSDCTTIPGELEIHTAPREPVTDPTLGIDLPEPAGPAPAHRLVAIGDSLTHGFMSAAIYRTDVSWPAIVAYEDINAAQAGTWTQWTIPLQSFADQGINLTNVDTLAVGLGTKAGLAGPGGSGTIYIDDIRLYRSQPQP